VLAAGKHRVGTTFAPRHHPTRTIPLVERYLQTSHQQKGKSMPKDTHQKAAEHHEQAAKAHRTAAQQHGSNDHVNAKQQSAQAMEKSKTAHELSTQANAKSQQQK
jgi:hypothetical protein